MWARWLPFKPIRIFRRIILNDLFKIIGMGAITEIQTIITDLGAIMPEAPEMEQTATINLTDSRKKITRIIVKQKSDVLL
jgi:hypothetical protein